MIRRPPSSTLSSSSAASDVYKRQTQYQDSGPPKGFGTPAGGKQKGWCALHLRQGAGESPQPGVEHHSVDARTDPHEVIAGHVIGSYLFGFHDCRAQDFADGFGHLPRIALRNGNTHHERSHRRLLSIDPSPASRSSAGSDRAERPRNPPAAPRRRGSSPPHPQDSLRQTGIDLSRPAWSSDEGATGPRRS